MTRREFTTGAAAGAAVGILTAGAADARPAAADGELHWLTAAELRDRIARKEVSVTEVVQHFLARADALDPTLHVYATLDREGALAQAKTADAAIARGDDLGAVHGVPIAVKDHVPVRGFKGHQVGDKVAPIAQNDHFGVERLRKAGAIIMGTNSMLGAGGGGALAGEGRFTPLNWKAEALSPWDTGRVPGWSSSGGAASVAAGMLPVAIGSDGGGSTRLPASYSGVVGLHPTAGLIPELDYARPRPPAGITVGPLTRSVRDAALVTQVMAGPDGRDPFSLQSDPDDFLVGIDKGVKGMKFAWTDNFGFAERYAAPESARVIALCRAEAIRLG
ncbi:MAG: amidase, partial [Rhizorhabdus sp.]|nr:amidase [Rhizorhabdus sp.]